MQNYLTDGMVPTLLRLSNAEFERVFGPWFDLWTNSMLQLYYAPITMMTAKSPLDFAVWPNQELVRNVYNTNLCRFQTNVGGT